MEGFYVVFDRAQKRIGFAVSACHGESTSEEGKGSVWSCSPRQQLGYPGPFLFGGSNSCLWLVNCAKARAEACSGEPCLMGKALVETCNSQSFASTWKP